jgi:hypothetical protein
MGKYWIYYLTYFQIQNQLYIKPIAQIRFSSFYNAFFFNIDKILLVKIKDVNQQ